tara:strand:+ start:3587 stop:4060 length:474 start_codon:yes stop_codon:yes gene_type:complete
MYRRDAAEDRVCWRLQTGSHQRDMFFGLSAPRLQKNLHPSAWWAHVEVKVERQEDLQVAIGSVVLQVPDVLHAAQHPICSPAGYGPVSCFHTGRHAVELAPAVARRRAPQKPHAEELQNADVEDSRQASSGLETYMGTRNMLEQEQSGQLERSQSVL